MLIQLQIGMCGFSYIEEVEVTNFSTVTLPRQATLNFLGMVINGPLSGPSQVLSKNWYYRLLSSQYTLG